MKVYMRDFRREISTEVWRVMEKTDVTFYKVTLQRNFLHDI